MILFYFSRYTIKFKIKWIKIKTFFSENEDSDFCRRNNCIMNSKEVFSSIGIIDINALSSVLSKLQEDKFASKVLELSKREEILTLKEACKFLKISRSTLYRLKDTRKISFVQSKKGNKLTFRKSHLIEYLERSTKGMYTRTGNPFVWYLIDYQFRFFFTQPGKDETREKFETINNWIIKKVIMIFKKIFFIIDKFN